MHMSVIRKCSGVIAIVLLTTAVSGAGQTPTVKVSGTYSNLRFESESGDLLGMEIKVVPVGEGFQAAILVSEGEPQPMVVVNLRLQGTAVSFDVPGDEGAQAWTFSGTITSRSLNGTIKHRLGGTEKITLPRRCGYWDR